MHDALIDVYEHRICSAIGVKLVAEANSLGSMGRGDIDKNLRKGMHSVPGGKPPHTQQPTD